MGIRLRAPNGSAVAPSHSFSTDSDTGFFRSASNVIGVSCGGVEVYKFAAGGQTLVDDVAAKFGTGNDIAIAWDGTRLNVTQAAANSEIRWGVDAAGIDQRWYGDSASVNMLWDQSADSLIFNDNAKVVLGTGSDDTIVHNGTSTTWTHITGNLVIDNTLVTGFTYADLGTDTYLTGFGVRNNSGTAAFLVLGSGTIIERSARKLVKQATPTAKTTNATLTAAEILVGLITVDGAASATTAQQLPTVTDWETALPEAATGDAFDFSVNNISTDAAEICTITTNTGWTLVGNVTIAANSGTTTNSFGRFRAYKTGAAAWTLIRIA